MTSIKIQQLITTLNSSLFKDVPEQLMDNLYHLGQLTKEIEQFAPSYDYNDIQFNGCRSLLKIIDQILPIIKETLLSANVQLTEPLIEVVSLFVDLFTMVVDLHHANLTPIKGSTSWHLDNFISSRSKVQNKIKTYWKHFSLFFVEPQSRSALRLFAFFAGLISGFPNSLSSLISPDSNYSRMSEILYGANAFFPLSILNAANNPLTSAISTLHSYYHRTEIKKLTISRQTDWMIPKSGKGRVTFCPTEPPFDSGNNNFVTCRLLTYTGLEPSGDLVFHVRGGAFVIDVPLLHDTYLMEWIPHLGGAVILDVDYTRAVRYPVALQEILDLYLWLVTQTTKVTETLGFTPRRIVFCGDSGGAYLLFTLAAVLRDIQQVSQESVPIFPTAFVGFYPIFSFNHQGKIPSLVMGFLDTFLNLNTVYQGLSLYASGITFDSDFESSLKTLNEHDGISNKTIKSSSYNHDNNNNQDSNRYSKDSQWERVYNTWFNSDNNWYTCDKSEFDRRSSKIVTDSKLPYISPMVSYDINTLDDLPIYMVIGEFDPFLDMTIDYAKNLSGKVKLDIMPDLPHGFLNMTHFSEASHKGSKVCLQKLIEALEF